jgi:hypothetical protein
MGKVHSKITTLANFMSVPLGDETFYWLNPFVGLARLNEINVLSENR